MPNRKKSSPESETARGEEFATASQNPPRTRKTTATETAATAGKRKANPKSAAATHMAPARKSVTAAPPTETAVEAVVIETAAFDISLHHEEISKEAYYNWLKRGCPQGSEHHDWLAAIELVRTRHQR
jgi:hypothetical protein